MNKIIKEALVNELIKQVTTEQITFSRMVEILNEQIPETISSDRAFPMLTPTGYDQPGVSVREYFAAMALQGIISAQSICETGINHKVNAESAVQSADALIEELNKEVSNA